MAPGCQKVKDRFNTHMVYLYKVPIAYFVVRSMSESYDREWVVKGPHASMIIKHPIEQLEREILSLLRGRGGMRLSQLWLRCNCHLWEVSFALERLKDEGFVDENPLRP